VEKTSHGPTRLRKAASTTVDASTVRDDDHVSSGAGKTGETSGGVARWVPGVAVARHYRRHDLPRDVVAGVVLTAFLIPVGMAYAQASGLPPVHGLYATIVPLLVYAVFGPSRILVLGPDSSLAPLIAAAILPLAMGSPDRAVALAGALAIGTGAICLVAGALRFGFITELLSIPVRYGYLNGVVTVVIVSQVPIALGIEVEAGTTIGRAVETIRAVLRGEVVLAPFAIAAVSFVGIVVIRRLRPILPGVLFAVVGSSVVVAALGIGDDLVLVGTLPAGLPSPVWPDLRWSDLGPVAAGAFTVAIVALTDTSLLSRAFAARRGLRVDPDRELVALGAANLAAGFGQGFAVSASSSRTPVALSAGARTQLTNVVAAVLIAVLLVAWPGALRTLPVATLAAVVIAAVVELIEVRGVARLARIRTTEFLLSMIAFVGVVTLGVLWGVAIAVGFSLLALIQRAWRPHTTTLVRVDGTKGYHDAARHPEGREVPGLVLYRFGAPLFFANAELFRREVLELARAGRGSVRWVVVAAGSITDIDATADQMLVELHRELSDADVVLAFAELKGVVRDRIEETDTVELIGRDRFFPTVGRAVRAYTRATDTRWTDWQDADEDDSDGDDGDDGDESDEAD
jgi:high affinity sulfate transporter 1